MLMRWDQIMCYKNINCFVAECNCRIYTDQIFQLFRTETGFLFQLSVSTFDLWFIWSIQFSSRLRVF